MTRWCNDPLVADSAPGTDAYFARTLTVFE